MSGISAPVSCAEPDLGLPRCGKTRHRHCQFAEVGPMLKPLDKARSERLQKRRDAVGFGHQDINLSNCQCP